MPASGIGIEVKTKPPIDKIVQPLKRTARTTSRFLDRKTKSLSQNIWKNLRGEAPRRTGALAKSIVHKKRGPGRYEVFVDRRTKGGRYEAFVRLGVPASKINPILPRRKKALFWPGAAHPVRAVYNHPGIKANDYWTRGLKKSESDIKKTEREIGDKIEGDLVK